MWLLKSSPSACADLTWPSLQNNHQVVWWRFHVCLTAAVHQGLWPEPDGSCKKVKSLVIFGLLLQRWLWRISCSDFDGGNSGLKCLGQRLICMNLDLNPGHVGEGQTLCSVRDERRRKRTDEFRFFLLCTVNWVKPATGDPFNSRW